MFLQHSLAERLCQNSLFPVVDLRVRRSKAIDSPSELEVPRALQKEASDPIYLVERIRVHDVGLIGGYSHIPFVQLMDPVRSATVQYAPPKRRSTVTGQPQSRIVRGSSPQFPLKILKNSER